MDLLLFQKINGFAGKYLWLDTLAIFGSEYLGYFLLFFLFLFLIWKKHWLMGAQVLVAVVLARLVIVEAVRWLWFRPRPFAEGSFNQLLEHANTASFPSGHAALYFAISVVIYMYNKKAGILFFFASFLIGLSRVFSGIHWPTDILSGAAVGIFSGLLIIFLSRKFFLVAKK